LHCHICAPSRFGVLLHHPDRAGLRIIAGRWRWNRDTFISCRSPCPSRNDPPPGEEVPPELAEQGGENIHRRPMGHPNTQRCPLHFHSRARDERKIKL
jgi:hypothetical protein